MKMSLNMCVCVCVCEGCPCVLGDTAIGCSNVSLVPPAGGSTLNSWIPTCQKDARFLILIRSNNIQK